jgi:3-deoxy-manno-octulosonate cytidylyltransferase (CMP-KDO synthetase)
LTFRIVIPARFGSERLPGKPLADIHGKPMIVHVVEAASRSAADEVLVATDDARIVAAVSDAGYRAVMTRSDHPSGSDRVMEVATREGWPDDAIVLNVQGDEPLIPPQVLDQLAACLKANSTLASATLCERLSRFEDLTNPNVVKVVRGADGRALYFSRAPIPFRRSLFESEPVSQPEALPAEALLLEGPWWRHIGVYGYRTWALRRFVDLPLGALERLERLEQLRMLENALPMQVEEACRPVPGGIDTEQDLERIRNMLD